MPALEKSDYEALLRAIEETRFVSDPALFPQVALRTVRRLVPCTTVSFNEVDPEAARAVATIEPPNSEITQEKLDALGRLAHEHPLIRYLNETGDGSAMKISDFLTIDEFHQTRIYRELYGPLEVEHQIAITLIAPLPRIVAIALNRSASDFDERDRELLNTIRPHLSQSYQLARERELLETLTGALRSHGSHVITLEPTRRDLTSGATDLLIHYFGPSLAETRLPAVVEAWLDEQPSRDGNTYSSELSLLRPLTAERDGTTLVLRYLPAADGRDAIVFHERPALLADSELRLLGLTPREAEILQLLTQGASDRDIAGRLHIAAGTVRKHLDNLYRKLGVNGRTQAIATTLQLLPGAPPG